MNTLRALYDLFGPFYLIFMLLVGIIAIGISIYQQQPQKPQLPPDDTRTLEQEYWDEETLTARHLDVMHDLESSIPVAWDDPRMFEGYHENLDRLKERRRRAGY